LFFFFRGRRRIFQTKALSWLSFKDLKKKGELIILTSKDLLFFFLWIQSKKKKRMFVNPENEAFGAWGFG